MQDVGSVLKRYGFDLVLVLVLVAGLFEKTSLFATAVIVAMVTSLFARRWFPFAAPALVWVIGAAASFVEGEMMTSAFSINMCGLLAAYLLGGLADLTKARSGLAVSLAGAVVVVANGPNLQPVDFVTVPATFLAAWLVGYSLRLRSDRVVEAEQRAKIAEIERDSNARVAVAEERARITRELHDVVAHAVSVMVLQVGAVRHRLPSGMGEERDALQSVEKTGRSALTEMRRLLGVVAGDDAEAERSPQPGLDRLDALVQEVRNTGLDVHLHREGEVVALPRAVDLSAYRIIQEGLTNCLKHANANRADVTLRFRPDGLEIDVTDDGHGPTAGDNVGRGIVGMRERVKIHGGEIDAGAGPGGGFRLAVSLPLRGVLE